MLRKASWTVTGVVDGQRAPLQVQGRGGKVRGGLFVAALRAPEGADVVVVDVVVFHGGMAHRAVGPVVVDAGGGVRVGGAAVQAEPAHLLMAPGKAAGQGIVGIEEQLRLRVDGRQDGVVHPLRVAVPGQLVPVEIGDDELRGVEVPEALSGIPLIGLDQQHVRPHPAGEVRVGQHQGGDALDLVGALLVVDHGLPRGPEDGGDHLHRGGLAVGAGDGEL